MTRSSQARLVSSSKLLGAGDFSQSLQGEEPYRDLDQLSADYDDGDPERTLMVAGHIDGSISDLPRGKSRSCPSDFQIAENV